MNLVKAEAGTKIFANYSDRTQHPVLTVFAVQGKGNAVVVALSRQGRTDKTVQVPEGAGTAFVLEIGRGCSVEVAEGEVVFSVT